MSFEHPNRNNESMIDVERDIMSRPSERNTTNLDLQRMKMILDIMGHPEQSFRVIHITGTNGKGSTARMAEAICRAYGMRTGLYTSPHLEHVNERIAIDGQQLSDDDFVDTWDQIKDLVAMVDMKMEELDKPKMSFFEVLTAMAIWKFADAPVDVAIVEVGMGGRWDATNVLDADAAIIGPIDMDHMAWLGNTVEQIASEKVGIIKPGCTAVIGRQPHEEAVMPIIEEAARQNHANLVRDGIEAEVVTRIPAVGGQVATLRTPNGTYAEVPIAKFGEHQAHNALAALCAAEVVIPVNGALDGDLVAEALSTVRIPGRIEQIRVDAYRLGHTRGNGACAAMADLFVYGDVRVDAALRLRAGVLHVFRKAEQNADGELVVQETALYVSGFCYPRARVKAHEVADLDAERAGVFGGLDVLIQHKLGRVEAALGVGEVAVDMDGGIAELERTLNDRAAAGVQPRVLSLAVCGAQPA